MPYFFNALPTAGEFEMRVYRESGTGAEAIAMVARVRHGEPRLQSPPDPPLQLRKAAATILSLAVPNAVLLRVQDQCMTSEIFGSVKCDCRQQLELSLAVLHSASVAEWSRRHGASQRGLTPTLTLDSDAASCDSTTRSSVMQGSSVAGDSDIDVDSLGQEPRADNAGNAAAHARQSLASATSLGRSSSGYQLSAAAAEGLSPSAFQSALLGAGARLVSRPASSLPHSAASASASALEKQGVPHPPNVQEQQHLAADSAPLSSCQRCESEACGAAIVGVVVYLMQEGRGIGLAAKVAAYALQETTAETTASASSRSSGTPCPHCHYGEECNGGEGAAHRPAGRGLDTVDANRALGLPDDAREYSAVRDILRDLRILADPSTPPPPLPTGLKPPPSEACACSFSADARGASSPLSSAAPIASSTTAVSTCSSPCETDATSTSTASSSVRSSPPLPPLHGDVTEPSPSPTSSAPWLSMTAAGSSDAGRPPSGSIALLTNNPRKLELLQQLGVPISTRLACLLPPISPLAADYLNTKAVRMGHLIPEHARRFVVEET